MTVRLFALFALFGCASPPAPVVEHSPEPGVAAQPPAALITTGGRYGLKWISDPAPLPFNTLFSVRTVLLDRAGIPIPNGSVTVDALMPQHGHGMQTHPIVSPGVCPTGSKDPCTHPDGVYVSEGLKFHMQGEWVLHFDVTGPNGPDVADVHYKL